MTGRKLREFLPNLSSVVAPRHRALLLREVASISLNKFPGVILVLGPEMKSTGEVMGVADNSRRGLRQGADRSWTEAAHPGNGVHQRYRS
jgi:carbamoylphosphate synthase large subunit